MKPDDLSLPPVFPGEGRMDEAVGKQLSSLVYVSTCLYSVAQDLMYYSYVARFGLVVAWTQKWDMQQQLSYCSITLCWQGAYKPCNRTTCCDLLDYVMR
jgi:hypothetical protein